MRVELKKISRRPASVIRSSLNHDGTKTATQTVSPGVKSPFYSPMQNLRLEKGLH